MAYNIGLNVVEVDGAAPPTIVGAAVSVAGFNILTQRGVPNRATRVTSFAQFTEQFGSFFAGGLGAYMVKGFFDNGGQRAYINRVVATDALTGAEPASITLKDGAGNNTLTLEGGFRGTPDPGTWAAALQVRVQANGAAATSRLLETAPATVTGSALTAPVNMSSAAPLKVVIDGESSPTEIVFQASDFPSNGPTQATLAEIRDAINKRTTKLIASLDGTKLVLTSTGEVARLRKDWTSLKVSEANATVGFALMANPVKGTPAAFSGTSTRLANANDFQVGDAVRITDGTRTAHVKIQHITPATNTIEWTSSIADAGSYLPLATTVTVREFDLTIARGGSEDENVVERWTGLSMETDLPNYAPRRLNDSLSGSRYVVATDESSASGPGQDLPAVLPFTRPTNLGRDGTPTANDFIGSEGPRTGFYAFEALDIQLLTSERTDPAIVTTALGYCARRGDCMYVGSVPEGYVPGGQATAYGQAFQGKNVYGALYGPWIKVFDPVGVGPAPTKWVPPVGHVMGVYARVESTRGIWKAPAGDEASLAGALDVEYRLSDTDHTDLVKSGSVNGIRVIPGAGIVVDSSRTLSTDTRWLYVNVRLLFNYVKSSLRQGLRWTRQEPNRDTLWDVVKYTTVTPFLMGLWRNGAFGSGSPEEVFTVICDKSNNPPEEVDKGNFKLEVYFYPSKPAETIIIIVGQQPSGGMAREG